MKTNTKRMMAVGAVALLYLYNALASDIAEKVISEEITGIVVEKASGKPVANAVVAIRFMRANTGHGSPHCFRSMATETDASGRFRFEPWTQEDSLANSLQGEVVAYKQGYGIPRHEVEYITNDRRSLFGIRWSRNLHISKAERRVEVREWGGTDEDRMTHLMQVVGQFNCSDASVKQYPALKELYARIRREILESPIADKALHSGDSSSYTYRSWILAVQEQFDR